VSTPTGFKIMVNEHNRIMIPIIFLTETQLTEDEKKWMHGVRIREEVGIDLLEGAKPNMGWLGPEMSGEEGATFKEKLAWAVGEAKSRMGLEDSDSLGNYYDAELLEIDEKSNMQLLVYGSLAEKTSDVLPGHIWVERQMLETQNMKYYCPLVLQALLKEQNNMVNEYIKLDLSGNITTEEMVQIRKAREAIKEKLNTAVSKTTPLKWVNRLIMWCAEKQPSFGKKFIPTDDVKVYVCKKDGTPTKKIDVKGSIEKNAELASKIVNQSIAENISVTQMGLARKSLLAEYYKP